MIPVLPHTASDAAAAEAVAQALFGFEATARPLAGEFDHSFHLQSGDGRDRVLKIMAAGRPAGLVELQVAALAHLARRDESLNLPRVCPARDGQSVSQVTLAGGQTHDVWLLTYLPGRLLARTRPHSPALLASLGAFIARLDLALTDFDHPAAHRPDFQWDLREAGQSRQRLAAIPNPARRQLAERFLDLYEGEAAPHLAGLPQSVIHGDANDYNVLVNGPDCQPRLVSGLIDFGDLHHSCTVAELAVAAAYALLEKADPLAAAARVVAGYHRVRPLSEQEVAVLFPLIAARLVVSVTTSAWRQRERPEDAYVTISEAPAWAALERLAATPPRLAHYRLRDACGLEPVPRSRSLVAWLEARRDAFAPVLEVDLRRAPCRVLDLSVGSLLLGADPAISAGERLDQMLAAELAQHGAVVGVGRYDEPRLLYAAPQFAQGDGPLTERRTIHLGLDLFVPAGSPIHAPLDGHIHTLARNPAPQDYGPVLILAHRDGAGQSFYTLYGHLDPAVLKRWRPGQAVRAGEQIAAVGARPDNGGWPPHLHFQLITDLLALDQAFPGVAPASQRAVWRSLSPDPNLLLGIPADRFPSPEPDREATLAARRHYLGSNLRLSYAEPLKIVRGWRQYLYDETGRAYLDVYNNVPHVGHSHPRVVEAVQRQIALLNTNTRYLHDNLVRYTGQLTALMPDSLTVAFLVNSGSEAIELALRLARSYTGRPDTIVLEAAYHGHTTGAIAISPYKFAGPGGAGPADWVHVAPLPDDYRGPFRRAEPAAGAQYAATVAALVDRLAAAGRPPGAFIAESLPSVAGQIVFPRGYLSDVYAKMRAAGGICIADEIQVGFGRLGHHFWGFASQGVVPDIVVLGKPIANGFPLGAVVTTRAIADAFANGMEFFSTFGGNPVACAAGLAVLEVLEAEALQAHARAVGDHLLAGLQALVERHPAAGDARGLGLFLGLDLVQDPVSRAPATAAAAYVVERLRQQGILTGTEGPGHNVLKLRPPLPFSRADADLLLQVLDATLAEDFVREPADG